ncbi:hypothetical protein EXY23_05795 [Roseicella aquatilis]|uniref:Uncharacterized protein n=2 Tax=Roseicella aquatilis TaxID=2527868 RepID=A0A4R4DTE2_9PROT|nr:hypothetical protein EXY23_05795 [Roseicella aquatilis]
MSIQGQTLTVDVPVTFRVSIACPAGTEAEIRAAAQGLARVAVEHLAHVGAAQIDAFNEVNRLHPHGQGRVQSVSASVQAAG